MVCVKESDQPYDHAAFAGRVRTAVAEMVRQQSDAGVDVVSDGEAGKPGCTNYVSIFQRVQLLGLGEFGAFTRAQAFQQLPRVLEDSIRFPVVVLHDLAARGLGVSLVIPETFNA
jgi:hypothetical protein